MCRSNSSNMSPSNSHLFPLTELCREADLLGRQVAMLHGYYSKRAGAALASTTAPRGGQMAADGGFAERSCAVTMTCVGSLQNVCTLVRRLVEAFDNKILPETIKALQVDYGQPIIYRANVVQLSRPTCALFPPRWPVH
jgi:hypothetical protein